MTKQSKAQGATTPDPVIVNQKAMEEHLQELHEKQIINLVRDTVDSLNILADRLEAYIDAREGTEEE
jgi:hypothetical protein